jgi:hypothetical protein
MGKTKQKADSDGVCVTKLTKEEINVMWPRLYNANKEELSILE